MLNKLLARTCQRLTLTCLAVGFSLTFNIAVPQYNHPVAAASTSTSTFILLINDDASNMTAVETFIKIQGGHITHSFPYQALIADLPAGVETQITTLPGVALALTQPIDLSLVDIYGPAARRYAAVWNTLITPPPDTGLTAAGADHPFDPANDALEPPDLPPGGGIGATADSVTPGYYQTSEYMAGSVAVGIVLVESNGSVDPSTENWTADEKQLVFNKIVAALNWWAARDPRTHLSFVYDDHFSNPLPTGVEPITRPYYHQQYWISDAMSALGYNAVSYFSRVRDYNNALRATYHTDWAFTIFVVDSSTDSDNRFSDGYFAYAYLGGPFLVLTYGNNGYGPGNMDAVAAHEIGHIFLALDQYYGAYQTCTRRSGYLNIENQNSEYGGCSSRDTSIMRGQVYPYTTHALDAYAAGQIGWRDSDGDNILDPLDTALPITIGSLIQQENTITVSGSTNIIPYPSPSRTSITINTLTSVQYRFNNGPWQPAQPADGAFDSTAEAYYFTATLSPGFYQLEVAAFDSAGNISADYATHTITIFDPVTGGLNTQLFVPGAPLPAGESSAIAGVTYNLAPDGIVTNVQYQVNDSSLTTAFPADGNFDSNYEDFSLTIPPLDEGIYTITVFATDGEGNVEIKSANLQLQITASQNSQIFLPLVMK